MKFAARLIFRLASAGDENRPFDILKGAEGVALPLKCGRSADPGELRLNRASD